MTIEDGIDKRLRSSAERLKLSYKQIIHRVLEKGLERLEVMEAAPRYNVDAQDYGLQAGIDSAKFNQLYDELESGEQEC